MKFGSSLYITYIFHWYNNKNGTKLVFIAPTFDEISSNSIWSWCLWSKTCTWSVVLFYAKHHTIFNDTVIKLYKTCYHRGPFPMKCSQINLRPVNYSQKHKYMKLHWIICITSYIFRWYIEDIRTRRRTDRHFV